MSTLLGLALVLLAIGGVVLRRLDLKKTATTYPCPFPKCREPLPCGDPQRWEDHRHGHLLLGHALPLDVKFDPRRLR